MLPAGFSRLRMPLTSNVSPLPTAMISIDIPGFGRLELAHLVSDYNGTLALDGELLPGVANALSDLAPNIRIHVITADTFGLAGAKLAGLPIELTITPIEGQA